MRRERPLRAARLVVSVVTLVLVATRSVDAQEPGGTVRGVVVDEASRRLAGATIRGRRVREVSLA